jgi:LacI family transcriptional regulator
VPGRPTIRDLARAAGVSVATVDRVLNRRLPVRDVTVERVIGAAQAIGFHAAALLEERVREAAPAATFGFLLLAREDNFYRELAGHLEAATRASRAVRGRPVVDYLPDLSPATVVEHVERLGSKVDALAVVSVDHPLVSEAVARLKARGVSTFAILTDLTAEARAGYVGRDNRKEGRSAAWMIARTARRPGKVGIIIGSHRFLCQETAEISFRSYLREHAPDIRPLEPLVNLEDASMARRATLDLVRHNADLVGVYICGGGAEGVIAAAREAGTAGRIAIVCNEITATTRLALIDGILTAVIATPLEALARRTVEAMGRAMLAPVEGAPLQILVPFDLCIAENI